jgi:hypothetical protein
MIRGLLLKAKSGLLKAGLPAVTRFWAPLVNEFVEAELSTLPAMNCG